MTQPVDKVANPDHYTAFAIQPLEYILANNIPFPEGNVVKYVSRWRGKNGVEDLKKARSVLDKLIAFEETGSIHGKRSPGAAEETSLAEAGLSTKAASSIRCKTCRGTGAADVFAMEPCGDCLGSGRANPGYIGPREGCRTCDGFGVRPSTMLDADHTKAVREFIKASADCARHTGTSLASPAPFQADCFHKRAAAYAALPAFLKD